MKTFWSLVKRNMKLFFNDKGMFLTSLITPMILLVLYITFLGNVYRDSLLQNFSMIEISDDVINGVVSGQLVSSILAVSCVTVAFCSNFLMVQDKALGNIKDLTISPVKSNVLSLSYYFASLFSTLIICLFATVICLIYIGITGWYLSVLDVLLIFVDVVMLVLFGTILSSIINHFLSTQGQISAVGTVVSSIYGFLCGAYMPLSSFPEGLQKVLSFLPGTYGTSLLRNHSMNGALEALENEIPTEYASSVNGARDAFDLNLYFFGEEVSEGVKFIILGVSIVVLITVYLLLNKFKRKKA
jgi:multidrug/hemolysin transport system permease protein